MLSSTKRRVEAVTKVRGSHVLGGVLKQLLFDMSSSNSHAIRRHAGPYAKTRGNVELKQFCWAVDAGKKKGTAGGYAKTNL